MSKFCVIAKTVQPNNKIPRKWMDSEDEAIAHAGSILANYCYQRDNTKLVVVEAKCIVERKADFDVRPIRETDLG